MKCNRLCIGVYAYAHMHMYDLFPCARTCMCLHVCGACLCLRIHAGTDMRCERVSTCIGVYLPVRPDPAYFVISRHGYASACMRIHPFVCSAMKYPSSVSETWYLYKRRWWFTVFRNKAFYRASYKTISFVRSHMVQSIFISNYGHVKPYSRLLILFI